MKKHILTCGSDGGSLSVYEKEEQYFYEIDESTLDDLSNEPLSGGLQISKTYKLLTDVLQVASDKHKIESLYLEKVSAKKKEVVSFVLSLNPERIIEESWLKRLFDIDKYYNKFVNLNLGVIAKASKPLREDNYLRTYPYFINFFKENKLNFQNYVVGVNMIYAWMPTTLNLDLSNKEGIEVVLEKLNKGYDLGLLDYEVLKKSINNSVVGMSKFLHFVEPYKYPIIDSKIYKFITGNKYSVGIDRSITYVAYKNMMNDLIREDLLGVMKPVYNGLNYKVSPLRGVEMLMFYA